MFNKDSLLKILKIILGVSIALIFLIVLFSGIMHFFFPEKVTAFNQDPYTAFSSWIVTLLGTLLGLVGIVVTLILFILAIPEVKSSLRKVLLSRVKTIWITDFLKNIPPELLLEIGKELQPSKVERSLERDKELSMENRPLLLETTIYQVFEENGRLLLILGEAGSGKTTTLLQLTEELIKRAEENEQEPVPVVFDLSSWAEQQLPLSDWLADELQKIYRFSAKDAKNILLQEKLLPLLDGLDEVRESERGKCLEAINKFVIEGIKGKTPLGLVVCCRSREYENLERLKLFMAVSLQPLQKSQITHYLTASGENLADLQLLLETDQEMWDLAQLPLILYVMKESYQQNASFDDKSDKRSQLFDRYIEKMFSRRPQSKTKKADYSQTQIIKGLSWLAAQMQERGQTTFFLENLQPDWLPTRLGYRLLAGLFGGLFGGLIAFLLEISFIFVGLVTGFIFVLASDEFKTLRWSWNQFRVEWLIQPLIFTMAPTVQALIILALVGKEFNLNIGVSFGLYFGIPFGLIVGILFWIGLAMTGVWMLTLSKFFLTLLIFVFLGFLLLGGDMVFFHYILRLILILERYTPWNYVRFLDYATRLILLRKFGGGYIFIHRLMLEHFANKKDSY